MGKLWAVMDTFNNLRTLCLALLLAVGMPATVKEAAAETKFSPIQTQFLAALADPTAKSGTGAEKWGLWRLDPGPRGVQLSSYDQLVADGGITPWQWKFDAKDWWLEEHGLIMEAPDVGVPAGTYLVTGDRTVMTALTIFPKDKDGQQRWELADNATLYDVTHLRCRSARYTPLEAGKSCTPAKALQSEFPVAPGAAMPPVEGCAKQDYAVVFIVGMAGS
jgi:hypothetical protein